MIIIPVRSIMVRLFLLALLVAGGIVAGRRVVLTAFGESIASYVERNQALSTAARLEAADLAVRYAPFDPLARLRRGGEYLAVATEEADEARAAVAVTEIREAAVLAPSDYRIWLALGRALDRVGDPAGARDAFERSFRLAPHYFDPHWAFGNHLLRQGDREGAFRQMREALTRRPAAFSLIFDYAWEAYAGDVVAITRALDPPPEVLAKMAALLVRRQQTEAGLGFWRQIAAPSPAETRELTLSLLQAAQPGTAWRIWSDASLPGKDEPDSDSLLANGGFEKPIRLNTAIPFLAWQVGAGAGVRVTLDRKEPGAGSQSLRVSFSLENNQPVTVATQIVPVTPGRDYCLTFMKRTEELKSLSLPRLELFDTASPDRAYAATPPFADELPDWTPQELRVRTAPATETLTVRLQRPPCADPFCSIEGRLWLDSFRLGLCREP
jgi:tetratricopeptide (TPR) repeat protein